MIVDNAYKGVDQAVPGSHLSPTHFLHHALTRLLVRFVY